MNKLTTDQKREIVLRALMFVDCAAWNGVEVMNGTTVLDPLEIIKDMRTLLGSDSLPEAKYLFASQIA